MISMSRMAFAVCVTLLLAACGTSSPTRSALDTDIGIEPRAATAWVVGSEWSFTVKGKGGARETFIFRVTERQVGNGQWVELETVQDPRPAPVYHEIQEDGSTSAPLTGRHRVIARRQGDHLEIALRAGVTDIRDTLVGTLAGDRFLGSRQRSSLVGDSTEPGIEGRRIR